MCDCLEGGYSLQSRLDLMPKHLQELFMEFCDLVQSSVRSLPPTPGYDPFCRTHARGVTFLCGAKSFVIVDFNQTGMTIKFYMGASEIRGLRRTTWSSGKDGKAGAYQVRSRNDLHPVGEYARSAYRIRVSEG